MRNSLHLCMDCMFIKIRMISLIYVKSSLCWEPKVAVIGGNPETIHVNGI